MHKLHFIFVILFVAFVMYRFMRHWNNFKHLALFIFSWKKFAQLSAKKAIEQNLKNIQGFKEHFENDESWRRERLTEYEKDFISRTEKLKNSIKQGFITIILVTISAYLSAVIVTKYFVLNPKCIQTIQIGAALLILWALLSKLGWPIQSFKGQTLPEQIDNFWFILLNIIGSYLLFTTYFCNLVTTN